MTVQSWVDAARMARDNARQIRRDARTWRAVEREKWAEECETQALKAFDRARWYIGRAMMTKDARQ